ncbi:hypothetical protein [Brevundimonas sp. Root1279]|uniref:hypothetical protein n=1 Tax=Brevundimonas sp. Root1279 TaxID=1736443 RepID=UPI0006F877E3|nr:hypothetical protein [Brevundimonas sp. Root1279]KQW82203.1 hypothetical protein ASC65_07945 [Brevundimonas sp. Root1279]
MRVRRRPVWLWVAAAFVCITGLITGPALYAAVEFVWLALQPRTFSSGLEVVVVIGLIGLAWLIGVILVGKRLHGVAGRLFVLVSIIVAAGSVVFERLQPPTGTTTVTMSADQAAVWSTLSQ